MTRSVLASIFCVFLSACAPFVSGSIKPITATNDTRETTLQPEPFNLDSGSLPGKTSNAYLDALADPAARNDLQDELIRRSNRYCAVFQDRLHFSDSAIGITLQSLAATSAIASSIVGGAEGAKILAAASGALTGTNAIIDSEGLHNYIVDTIVAQIDVDRRKVLQEIEVKQKSADYRIGQAIIDVQRYHYACNIIKAISKIDDSIKKAESLGDLEALSNIQRKILQLHTLQREGILTPESAKAKTEILVDQMISLKTD